MIDADLTLIPAELGPLIADSRLGDTSGGVFRHRYAATGKITADIPLAGAIEIDRAVRAAHVATNRWAAVSPPDRRDMMMRFADMLDAEADSLARLSVIDNGMVIGAASFGPTFAADAFRYCAGWADKIGGDVISVWGAPAFDFTIDEPYGVVAVIIPWNAPVYAIGMVLAPILAAGNCVVVKPPEIAPFAVLKLGEMFLRAGFPAGVVNIVPGGAEAGSALVSHPDVDKVHFTGSGETGKRVLAAAAQSLTPVQLELGGKSAALIFEDADIDDFAPFSISGLVNCSGQGCINAGRLLVHSSRYREVVDLVAEAAKGLRVGDPFDVNTAVGPVATSMSAERICGVIDRAKSDGAKLVAGGRRMGGELANGWFVEPSVFADVDPRSDLARNEVFGPVIAVMPFDSEEEAVALANDTEFGLAGYVFTQDVRRAHRVGRALQAGNIWINGFAGIPNAVPFGGNKASGFGRLGGIHGIREFLRPRNIWMAT